MVQQGDAQHPDIAWFADRLTLPADMCAHWSSETRTAISGGENLTQMPTAVLSTTVPCISKLPVV